MKTAEINSFVLRTISKLSECVYNDICDVRNDKLKEIQQANGFDARARKLKFRNRNKFLPLLSHHDRSIKQDVHGYPLASTSIINDFIK